jgi:cellulose synthase/poly-beta-1,6-N-acetylglucosamine synthase-like glycosyltransferase
MSIYEIVFFGTFFTLWIVFLLYFALMLFFSRKPSTTKKRSIFPSVSFIIPAYNEQKVMPSKLQNTAELDYPREKLETIIVDDGSTDSTKKIIKEFMESHDDLKIRFIEVNQRRGKANALNLAFDLSNAEIAIISDADVFLKRDAISQLVNNFDDERVGAVSGIEIILNTEKSSSAQMEKRYKSFYNLLRLGETNLDSVLMCESGTSAYRKRLVNKLSQKCVCDDMELTLTTRKKGFKTIYDPTVGLYHYTSPTLKSRLIGKIRHSQGNISTLLRFTDFMFKRKYGKFGLVVFPFEFFLHIISPALVMFCIFSFLSVVITSSNLFVVATPVGLIFFTTFLGSAILALASSPANTTSKQRPSLREMLLMSPTIFLDFIILQTCLFFALISLNINTRRHLWKKDEEAREIFSSSISTNRLVRKALMRE